jgi:hypothetical protein
MIKRFSTRKAFGLASLAIGLSAVIVAPALGVQNSLIFTGPAVQISEEAAPKNVDKSLTSPAGTISPVPLDQYLSGDTNKPSTIPDTKPDRTSAPVAASAPAPVVVAGPVAREAIAPTTPTPTPTPTPTQAPVVQQPPIAPIVGAVTVSQVTPENGLGEAVLQWSSIPGATEYRIFKTGTIRPSWRLFYIYPSSITSITIFDQPGSIAIYKIMAVINSQETLLGEVTYRPTN